MGSTEKFTEDVNGVDDDPRRWPLRPPGLRDTVGNDGGPWPAALHRQQFLTEFADAATALATGPLAFDQAVGLDQLAQVRRLRSRLDALEYVIMADTYEYMARTNAALDSCEHRMDDTSRDALDGTTPAGTKDLLSHLASSYYRVSPEDAQAARSSFVAEASLACRDTSERVHGQLTTAEALRGPCTGTLIALAAGDITTRTAKEIVKQCRDLKPDQVKRMEHVLLPAARELTDDAVRQRARRLREKLLPTSAEERHQQAAQRRTVRWWHEADGQSVLQLRGPAEDVIAIVNTLEHHVQELQDPQDDRCTPQQRFDTLRDALLQGWPAGGGSTLHTRVAVTIPALQLLVDRSKALADLEGYGPIPLGTALKIAKDAKSLLPVLTDPWSGAVIDVGRRHYRAPKALKDLLRYRDQQCQFPGCHRLADRSEVEHIEDWAKGGATTRQNTKPCCTKHQMFKHVLGWKYTYQPDGSVKWRSPNGQVCTVVPGSVTSVLDFDFARDRTPERPQVVLDEQVRRFLGRPVPGPAGEADPHAG